jgi:hypothetical protein
MSSIAVNAITDANAGNTATINSVTPNVNNVVGKNRIIGGDFTTNPWQRGTSFAAIANSGYSADRWLTAYGSAAVVTASKVVDAPTASQAGVFTQDCLSLAVTTTDTSIAAGDYWLFGQHIEGLNAASFGFGQAGSRNVTLSFWVKGTKTGIHCVAIRNSAGNRSYVAEYTIVTTNTWEYKTITIPVDTSGTWLYDNGKGVSLWFVLAGGTNFHTTANTWAAGNFLATANQVNALDSTANTFKIALVQLEAGSSATEFEHRPYGTELQLCQRYYQGNKADGTQNTASGNAIFRASSTGTGSFYYWMPFATYMRASPTMNVGTPTYSNASSAAFFNAKPNGAEILISVSVSGGYAVIPWRAEAEL